MSVPEELVRAAAEAPCLGAGKVNTGLLRGVVSCKGQRTKHPECALTAAFGALPRIGWLHPAYSMSTILNDGQKEALENRADDKTYKDGFLAVYSEPTT